MHLLPPETQQNPRKTNKKREPEAHDTKSWWKTRSLKKIPFTFKLHSYFVFVVIVLFSDSVGQEHLTFGSHPRSPSPFQKKPTFFGVVG